MHSIRIFTCMCGSAFAYVQAISWKSCSICSVIHCIVLNFMISQQMWLTVWFYQNHNKHVFTTDGRVRWASTFYLSNVVRLSCMYVMTKKADASRNRASSLLHKSQVVSWGTPYIVRHSSPVALQENANNTTKWLTTPTIQTIRNINR